VIDASNPSAGSELYTVSAIDSCGNTSDFDINTQKTIFLQGKVDICKREIKLFWTKYINWTPSVISYDIWASENGGSYSVVGSVFANDSVFVHKNVNKGSVYCYFIRAKNGVGGKTSTSNKFCITATVPNPPQWVYAIYATVKDSNQIEVSGLTDLSAQIKGFNIYRAENDTAWTSFSSVAIKNPTSTNTVLYSDQAVETQKKSYVYRLVVLDSCGAETLKSNYAKTILLTVVPNLDVTHDLSWTPYWQWPTGVEKYNIYRVINDSGDTLLIASVGAETLFYKDKERTKYEGKGKFCYMVEAVEASGNPLTFKAISRSNWRCVNQETTVYIPNAFNPADVYNPTFKPIITFADKEGYLFQVFNRWGQKIFETQDINAAWDGKIKGDKAPADIYAYRIEFKTNIQEKIVKTGTVVLIR
jgi:gliding motility-associated-like protein